MIVAIGIDSVEINRFAQWHIFSPTQLLRILSAREQAYCRLHTRTSAERFAAHFAIREAFFKALRTAYPPHPIPFLSICRLIELIHQPEQAPTLLVNWDALAKKMNLHFLNQPTVITSLTHTRTTATACVVMQEEFNLKTNI